MIKFDGLPVTVAGAGVFGLATAVRLAQAGAKVRVCDPDLAAANASAVAAGMLAPALETALDPVGAGSFALLRASRDLWPDLIEAIGAPPSLLDRSGAVLAVPPEAEAALMRAEAGLRQAGAAFSPVPEGALRSLLPGLSEGLVGLFTPEDWRLHPSSMLEALSLALTRAGGRMEPVEVVAVADGFLAAGERLDGPLVIAAGAQAAGLAIAAPELAVLQPIKGQVLHFNGGPAAGPTVRGLEGYVAPQPGGAIAGATMEPGRTDRGTDPGVLESLRRRAAALFPALAEAPADGRAGIRAATPDGLPLVGPSVAAGVVLAAGARRNGWLLAPLMAEIVVRTLAGEDAGPFAAALDPRRFS